MSFDPSRRSPGSSCAVHVPGSSRSRVRVTARIVPFTATASVDEAGRPSRSRRRPSSRSGSTDAETSTCCSARRSRSSTSSGAPTGSADAAGTGRPRSPRAAPEGTGETLPSNRLQRRATDSIRPLASAADSIAISRAPPMCRNTLRAGRLAPSTAAMPSTGDRSCTCSLLASVGRKSIACMFRSSTRPARCPGSLTKSGTGAMSATVTRSMPLKGCPGLKLAP